MILHKALVISSVIFNTIICIDGNNGVKDSEDYKNSKDYKNYLNYQNSKVYKNCKECKECEDFLAEIGFKSDSGLYNIMFFLQFNETVFKEKVRSKMENQNDHQINQNDQNHHDEPDKNNDQSIKDDIASNNDHQIDQNDQNHHDEPDENNDQSIKDDIASYLESCYREFNNDQNTMTLCKDLAKTPKEFCTSSNSEGKFFKLIETAMSIFFGECERSILDYELDKGGKKYKYDENNRYKCFLTSIDIGLNDELQKEKTLKKMKRGVFGYFNYHLDTFHIYNGETYHFTAPGLCMQYKIKKDMEPSNLQ